MTGRRFGRRKARTWEMDNPYDGIWYLMMLVGYANAVVTTTKARFKR